MSLKVKRAKTKMRKAVDVDVSEFKHSQYFFAIAQTNPILREYLIHIPNEGKRTFAYTKALYSIGMRKGIPDYILAYPNKTWGALWIELKTLDGGKVSIEQQNWIDALNLIGHFAVVAKGWKSAYQVALDYISDKI